MPINNMNPDSIKVNEIIKFKKVSAVTSSINDITINPIANPIGPYIFKKFIIIL
jgi:hypothetical protein